jgi:hypothetical protein
MTRRSGFVATKPCNRPSRYALGTIFASADAGGHRRNVSSGFLPVSCLGEQMGEVVQFIRKPDPDGRARLIQEARAIYESIFPTEAAAIAPTRTAGIASIGDDDMAP